MTLRCPGCGQLQEYGPAVQGTAMVTCPACAGAVFRLVTHAGVTQLREVPWASCPVCETVVYLPDTVQPGDMVHHCARTWTVTYAYGAYALEMFRNAGEAL